jgi:3-hydroxybutyryl-CoA dehydrogenase
MEIKKVGVVGCGTMGAGIALVTAQAGYPVVVSEINENLLNRGLGIIDSILAKDLIKGKITRAEKDAVQARITGVTSNQYFTDCDLIIEVVIENMALKKSVFAELDQNCPTHAILASNTSCLSILDLAKATKRPEKVCGIHFFNPAPVMKLVELVSTIETSEETLSAGRQFAESLGKTVIAAKNAPGFIVNRLLVPQLLNAVRMLEQGIGTKEDIDTGAKLGMNHPLGPFALIDLVGIDIIVFVANAIFEETKDPQFIIPVLLQKMYTAGRLGRKTGKGFYEYATTT